MDKAFPPLLHISRILAFLRSCAPPAIHVPHICYPHSFLAFSLCSLAVHRCPPVLRTIRARNDHGLCISDSVTQWHHATETYHLGDTIFYIPRQPFLYHPRSSGISSTSNRTTLVILSDTALVILFPVSYTLGCTLYTCSITPVPVSPGPVLSVPPW